jgi:hypothetical protein
MEMIAYNSGKFIRQAGQYSELDYWQELFKIIGSRGIGLNDRSQVFKFPINTCVPNKFKIPSFNNQKYSYEECALSQAQQILNRQDQIDKPIYIMYSGGIDSSVVLCSFIKLLGVEQAKKRINVIMNKQSVDENPEMWYSFIRPHFNVLNSDFVYNHTDITKMIYVSGELNDQLFGADIQQSYEMFAGSNSLSCPLSYDLLFKFISECKKVNTDAAHFWTNIFIKNLESCPRTDHSMWDVFWWYNFTWKWIYVYYRIFLSSRLEGEVDPDWLEKDYIPFFSSNEFQLWSMYSNEPKNHGLWDSYKFTAKKLVSDFIGTDFYMQKTKRQSLKNIVYLRPRDGALSSDLKVYDNLDINEVYQVDNIIKNHGII